MSELRSVCPWLLSRDAMCSVWARWLADFTLALTRNGIGYVLARRAAFLTLTALIGQAAQAIGDDDAARAQIFAIARNGNAIFLPVEMNSRQYRFLFDSGSAISHFDTSLKHLLGKPTQFLPVYTPADHAPVEMTLFEAPTLTLGTQVIRGVSQVFCIDFRKKKLLLDGRAPDGLLGMDALAGMIIRLDCDRGEFAVLRSLPKRPGTAVPLVLDRGVPFARLSLAAAPPASFSVDTGAIWLTSGYIESRLFRSLVDAREASVVSESPQTTLFGTIIEREAHLPNFSIAGFVHHDLLFSEASRNAISLNFLSRYIVIFDFPRMTMYLTPGARFAEADRPDLSGLHWRRDGNSRLVKDVVDGSPAAAAGLHEGDLLVTFDGVPAEQLTNLDLHRLLATPSTQWFTIRRGEETLRVKLELRKEAPPRPTQPTNECEAPRN
jgi:hypothetical protein